MLPGLVGTLSSLADFHQASFDFGQQFSAIENVWIEVPCAYSGVRISVYPEVIFANAIQPSGEARRSPNLRR